MIVMTNRDQPSKTLTSLKRRVIWLILIWAAMALYFLINRLVRGGVSLDLPVDKLIPLYPPFVAPYLLADGLFVALPVWAALRAKAGDFETYALCVLLATLVSYVVYISFPTYVNRPEVFGQDWFSRAVALLYRADQAHNAAPSGHAFYTLLSAIFLTRWKPRLIWLWCAMTLLILASTLLVRQHNLLDLAAGLALATTVYILINYLNRKKTFTFAS
jgi:membrane-associated phospholipid phosphatase